MPAHFSRLAGGAPLGIVAEHRIATPADRCFRLVFFLRFQKPDAAARLVFPEQEAQCRASFTILEFDGLTGMERYLPACLAAKEDAVIVTRPDNEDALHSIVFAAGLNGRTCRLMNVAGDLPGETILVQGPIAANRLALPPGFKERVFALRLTGAPPLAPATVQAFLGPAYEAAGLAQKGDDVVVSLDGPRPLHGVRAKSVLSGDAVPNLAVHRMDGETLADKATTSLREPFRIVIDKQVGLSKIVALEPLTKAKKPSKKATTALLYPKEPFNDARFALKQAGGLNQSRILEVLLNGVPTGQRLGLASPDNPAAAVFFWRQPGEYDAIKATNDGKVDAGSALAAALENHFAERTDEEGAVEVALVVESDAPCLFRIEALTAPYLLAVRGFEPAAEKQVLRFSDSAATSRDLKLRIPAGGTIVRALLECDDSFGDDRLIDLEGADAKRGVALEPLRWVGQRSEQAQAFSASGVVLALKTLVVPARLHLQLQEDAAGRPSGKVLADGQILLEGNGATVRTSVRFEKPVILSTAPYWLLIVAVEGRALWLTRQAKGQLAVFPAKAEPADRPPDHRHTGLAGLMGWLSREDQYRAAPAISVSLAGNAIAPLPPAGGRVTYDLATQLNAWLQANAPTTAASVPLRIQAATGGILTVYDPEIRYRLP